MFKQVKDLALPATLAVVGVQGSAFLGIKNPWAQIAAAIVGAGIGLAIANAVGK